MGIFVSLLNWAPASVRPFVHRSISRRWAAAASLPRAKTASATSAVSDAPMLKEVFLLRAPPAPPAAAQLRRDGAFYIRQSQRFIK